MVSLAVHEPGKNAVPGLADVPASVLAHQPHKNLKRFCEDHDVWWDQTVAAEEFQGFH